MTDFSRGPSAPAAGPSRISPIVINDNVIDVLARPAGKAGEPAVITIRPATEFVSVDAVVETVEEGKPAALAVERVAARGTWSADSCRSAMRRSSRSARSSNRPPCARAVDRRAPAARGAARGLAAGLE